VGAAAVPLILTAVGTGAQMYNTAQTEKKTRKALDQQLASQRERDAQGDAIVRDVISKTSASSPDEPRAQAMDLYRKAIASGQPNATQGLNQVGNVSDRYAEASQDAANDILGAANVRANQLANIDAPLSQRMTEGIRFGRAGSDIGLLVDAAKGDSYIHDLRLKRAATRDPWLDAFGSLAQGYGQGMAGGSSPMIGGVQRESIPVQRMKVTL